LLPFKVKALEEDGCPLIFAAEGDGAGEEEEEAEEPGLEGEDESPLAAALGVDALEASALAPAAAAAVSTIVDERLGRVSSGWFTSEMEPEGEGFPPVASPLDWLALYSDERGELSFDAAEMEASVIVPDRLFLKFGSILVESRLS
jgi:hypothetical protein